MRAFFELTIRVFAVERGSTDGYVANFLATTCVLAAEGSKEEGGYLAWVVRIQPLRIG